jgi:hypothetical protein
VSATLVAQDNALCSAALPRRANSIQPHHACAPQKREIRESMVWPQFHHLAGNANTEEIGANWLRLAPINLAHAST